jgi:ADP-ribosylglycohydrolase
MDLRDRVRGCLLGGAVGDALGAPVEFMSLLDIRRQFGPKGIANHVEAYGRVGAIRTTPR